MQPVERFLPAGIALLLAAATPVDAAYLSMSDLLVTRLSQDTFRVDVPVVELAGWEGPYQNRTGAWGYPVFAVAGTYGVEVTGGFVAPNLVAGTDFYDVAPGRVWGFATTSYGSDLSPFSFTFTVPTSQQRGRQFLSVAASAQVWSHTTDGYRDIWAIDDVVSGRRNRAGTLPGLVGTSSEFSAVPEPGTWLLLAGGLGALGFRRRRASASVPRGTPGSQATPKG